MTHRPAGPTTLRWLWPQQWVNWPKLSPLCVSQRPNLEEAQLQFPTEEAPGAHEPRKLLRPFSDMSKQTNKQIKEIREVYGNLAWTYVLCICLAAGSFPGFLTNRKDTISSTVWCAFVWAEVDRSTSPPHCATFYKINGTTKHKLPLWSRALIQPLPPLVWGGKHRQTDELELPQTPSSCLLLWGGNCTVTVVLNFPFFRQLYFCLLTGTLQRWRKSLLSADWLTRELLTFFFVCIQEQNVNAVQLHKTFSRCHTQTTVGPHYEKSALTMKSD